MLKLAAWAYAGEPLELGAELLYEVTQSFRDQYRGVNVEILPALAGASGSVVPSIIAGTGPDIIQDWDAGLWRYLNTDLVLPLDGFVKRDNVDLTVFNARQLDAYYDLQHRLIALPAQTDPTATAVNLSVLDEAGLPYPEDNWTADEATKLWRSVAGMVKGKRRYGGQIFRSSADAPDEFYLAGFGGAYVDPADPGRCVADSVAALSGLQWCYDLVQSKVCTWRGMGDFKSGEVVSLVDGSWDMPAQAQQWQGFKWRYYPMPTWPVRQATFCTTNFWAIPATVKDPDLAWALLRFVALSSEWQRGMMKIFLTVPTLKPLLQEWEAQVLAVAPILADKNIRAFSDPVRADQAYPTPPFARSSTQAYALISQWWDQALAGKVDLRTAMRQAAQQVNALEATAAAVEARHLDKAFPTEGPDIAAVPPGV